MSRCSIDVPESALVPMVMQLDGIVKDRMLIQPLNIDGESESNDILLLEKSTRLRPLLEKHALPTDLMLLEIWMLFNDVKLLKHDEPNVVSVFVMNMIDVIDIQFSNALSRICKLDEEEKDIDGIFLQFLNAVFEIFVKVAGKAISELRIAFSKALVPISII